MNNFALSPSDQAVLDELTADARIPVTELARKLGVSRTTAQQRINRLESRGVIAGYTIRLGPEFRSSLIRAHTSIAIEPNASAKIFEALETIAAIDTVYSVSGKVDLVAILSARSATELDHALDRISEIRGVRSTETAIVLSTRFDRRTNPLPRE